MDKEIEKILSEITGYSIEELKYRETEPLLQPYDCLLAMNKALNMHIVSRSIGNDIKQKLMTMTKEQKATNCDVCSLCIFDNDDLMLVETCEKCYKENKSDQYYG